MSDKIIASEKTLRIKHIFPPDLASHFVTNLIVQHQSDHFVLSFFELWPPPIVGAPEERKEALNKLDHINANCVSRLVVTPRKMKEFVAVINENMKNYELNDDTSSEKK